MGKGTVVTSRVLSRLISQHSNAEWSRPLSASSFSGYQNQRQYSQNSGNNHSFRNHDHENGGSGSWTTFIGAVGGFTAAGYISWRKLKNKEVFAATVPQTAAVCEPDELKTNLPTYRSSEIAEHYDAQRRIWVSFKRGVYDVTDFVSKHPGGSRIMMAAGGSLEPFWELYPVHQRSDVFEILAKYRIGNLAEEDVAEPQDSTDHFKNEPKRHPVLIRRMDKPFNGETPPSILAERLYTPNEVFYVRNHLPVPEIDVKDYHLEIEGIGLKKGSNLRLQDLKKFPKISISATIQCGGNRRSNMSKVKGAAGLPWSGGAIGNAKWTGARLKDVLKAAGFDPKKYPSPEKVHVQFEGLDSDQSGECYGASIPLTYFLDDNFEPLLAYEMNDKELPLDHGFPIRVILPGIVGARSVKWLSRIVISDKESQSPWQQRDYKVFSPSVTMETVDFSTAPAIMDTPVTSYICSPEDGDTVQKGKVKVAGYAFSGGGRDIVRVEISRNRGASWEVANIKQKASNGTRNWSWVLWEVDVDVNKNDCEIWVKAVDSGYNQQPEDFKNIWNYRGLLSNAYHKITLNVK